MTIRLANLELDVQFAPPVETARERHLRHERNDRDHQRRLAIIAAPFPKIGADQRIITYPWAGTIVSDTFRSMATDDAHATTRKRTGLGRQRRPVDMSDYEY